MTEMNRHERAILRVLDSNSTTISCEVTKDGMVNLRIFTDIRAITPLIVELDVPELLLNKETTS